MPRLPRRERLASNIVSLTALAFFTVALILSFLTAPTTNPTIFTTTAEKGTPLSPRPLNTQSLAIPRQDDIVDGHQRREDDHYATARSSIRRTGGALPLMASVAASISSMGVTGRLPPTAPSPRPTA